MKLTSAENNKPNSKSKKHEDPLKISQMPATSKPKVTNLKLDHI